MKKLSPLPKISPENDSITIKLIDANHCPGAALILIRGPLGTVLHTGDFRFDPYMITKLGFDPRIDYLYLDNTFSTTEEDFPPQEEAFEMLKNKIEKLHSEQPDLKFFIYCYTLGKEEVFVNLSRYFNTKVMVA